MIKRIFIYIKPLWTGNDGKPSLRAILAIVFSLNLVYNISKSLRSLDVLVAIVSRDKTINMADAQTISAVGNSLANASMILGIEASLIAALLSLTTIQNIQFGKKDTAAHINNVDNL